MNLIPYATQWIDQSDVDAVVDALRSPFLTQGPIVSSFESALSDFTGTAHAVAVSNGTAALHLACSALGLGEGDVGIVSPISFAATANCLRYCGAEVRFADVDPVTGLMDPESLASMIGDVAKEARRGVVIPVSLAGRVAPMAEVYQIAREHDFFVIEDAAQSLGAFDQDGQGRFESASCKYSDLATFSFHPVKHICAGEGGAVLTNHPEWAERVRLLRSHGIVRPWSGSRDPINEPPWYYEQVELGWNYRMTDIQCALALSQLERQEFFHESRQTLAERYRQHFKRDSFRACFDMTPHHPGHAYHLFVVHFKNNCNRDEAYAFFKSHGVLTQVHHIPIYRHPYYVDLYGEQALPGAEAYFDNCLSIPLFPKMSFSEQDKVISVMESYCKQKISHAKARTVSL